MTRLGLGSSVVIEKLMSMIAGRSETCLCHFYKLPNDQRPHYLCSEIPKERNFHYNLRRPNVHEPNVISTNRFSHNFFSFNFKTV